MGDGKGEERHTPLFDSGSRDDAQAFILLETRLGSSYGNPVEI